MAQKQNAPRVVHACDYGVKGCFGTYGSLSGITAAGTLRRGTD